MRLTPGAVCAAVLGLAATGSALATPATGAELLRWPVPWETGHSYVYESETIDRSRGPGRDEAMRVTDTTTVEIREGTGQGVVQAWTYADVEVEVVAGADQASADAIRAAAAALEDLPVLVRLDAESSYAGVLNIDEISRRFAVAMRPLLVSMAEDELAKRLGPGADDADRARGRTEMMARLDGMLERLASPAVLEASLQRQLDTFNAFTGIELEPGQAYEASVDLDNPLGQTPIPARVEFAMFLSDAHPGHGLLEWTSTIDPERGLEAVWEIAEALTGETLPEEARGSLPDGLELSDEGFFLFDLATGVPEMVEMERSVVLGDRREYDRDRMRLVSGDHDHEWMADAPEAAD